MSRLFILAVIFVFLTIFGESVNLMLQLKGRKLTKWFGSRAFTIHTAITGGLWAITFIIIILLQMEDHPAFHEHTMLQYTGFVLLIGGWSTGSLGV